MAGRGCILPKEGEEEGDQVMVGVLWQVATARGRHHRDGWREEEEVEDEGGAAVGFFWRSGDGRGGEGFQVQDSLTKDGKPERSKCQVIFKHITAFTAAFAIKPTAKLFYIIYISKSRVIV